MDIDKEIKRLQLKVKLRYVLDEYYDDFWDDTEHIWHFVIKSDMKNIRSIAASFYNDNSYDKHNNIYDLLDHDDGVTILERVLSVYPDKK
jgi:hypothetical protein